MGHSTFRPTHDAYATREDSRPKYARCSRYARRPNRRPLSPHRASMVDAAISELHCFSLGADRPASRNPDAAPHGGIPRGAPASVAICRRIGLTLAGPHLSVCGFLGLAALPDGPRRWYQGPQTGPIRIASAYPHPCARAARQAQSPTARSCLSGFPRFRSREGALMVAPNARSPGTVPSVGRDTFRVFVSAAEPLE